MQIANVKVRKAILDTLHWLVVIFSLLLIAYLSYDTFDDIPFLQNKAYMNFQLVVCVVFMLAFAVELLLSPNKWKYIKRHIFFFLISIPYLNIIIAFDIKFSPDGLYYIRFIPLIRAAFALAIVVGYVSKNKVSSLFASYLAILLSIVYFSSLIFYEREFPVNPSVTSYYDALWWAAMNVTTLGCPISPITQIGKILCVVLGGCGMMMFPLFTIYITNLVQQQYKRDRMAYLKMEGLPDSSTSETAKTSSNSPHSS